MAPPLGAGTRVGVAVAFGVTAVAAVAAAVGVASPAATFVEEVAGVGVPGVAVRGVEVGVALAVGSAGVGVVV